MGFNQLPIELIYKDILPFLEWNQLLSLRGVNHKFRTLVSTYIRKELGGIPDGLEIEINDYDKTWEDFDLFLSLDFPASYFYLNNVTGHEFFSGNTTEFLETFGHKIIQIRVNNFSVFPSEQEFEFYESLVNLKSLQIESVVLGPNLKIWRVIIHGLKPSEVELPKTFEKIKYLDINRTASNLLPQSIMLPFNVSFLRKCKLLNTVALGITSGPEGYGTVLTKVFDEVRDHVWRRGRRQQGTNLKIFDFKNFWAINTDVARKVSPTFLDTCRLFARRLVKFENVPANLFKSFRPELHQSAIISSVVKSMRDLHPVVLQVEMPHLTSLDIWTWQTSFRSPFPYLTSWPALEELFVFVATTKLWPCTRRGRIIQSLPVTELFDLLFGNRVDRSSLTTLRLIFSKRMINTLSSDLTTFPCPSVANIISSCPNIKVLELTNWPDADNLAFSKIWTGLPGLEDVCLKKCKLLGDEGFIGEDENRPAFLELKNLKRFWLLGLNKMPNITDKSFHLVFRHMRISEFHMQCDKPLKNITREGITALLSGDFGIFIQKFSETSWSLSEEVG